MEFFGFDLEIYFRLCKDGKVYCFQNLVGLELTNQNTPLITTEFQKPVNEKSCCRKQKDDTPCLDNFRGENYENLSIILIRINIFLWHKKKDPSLFI